MVWAITKVVLSACIISFVSWLSGKKAGLAGFLTALPLLSLLALAFSHMQWQDPKQSVLYANSILVAVPVSLMFFIPFLFAEKFQLGFWTCYSLGLALLFIGYLVHKTII